MTGRVALFAAVLLACEGPVGPPGDPGEPGPPGPPGDPAVLPDAGTEPLEIPLEPAGLVGRVLDTAGVRVEGRVVLVPAADVALLGQTPIDPTLSPEMAAASPIDEPIEDLLDAHPEYVAASIDADGVYRFVMLGDADVFVIVVPDGDAHLPGGELARAARSPSTLVGRRVDLHVSTRPSPRAQHVGSDVCVSCHGHKDAYGTAHFASLRVPRRVGYQQDTSRFASADAGLERFEAGATLYFYDCDAAASEDACRISEVPPPAPAVISFEAVLARDSAIALGEPGAYRVTLRNRRGTGEVEYPVELTYGGLLYGQQFLVPIVRAGGVERHALPFQYDFRGDASASFSDAQPWRDVGSASFYDHAAGTLREPPSDASFDRQCASCHFAGYALAGDVASGFRASALPSIEGAFDYDGDGRREQLDPGCEGCHGPGSEHLDAGGHGVAIVSPALITASRADAICGACHSREAPSPWPRQGDRRATLLSSFPRAEIAFGDAHASGDARRSRLQYAEHAGTRMHRGGALLVSCSDCHDPHGSNIAHDLRVPAADNAGCTGCHSQAQFRTPRMHVEAATGNPHLGVEDDDFVCTLCHMPPTARGGAMVPGLLDNRPTTDPEMQYWLGDLATHGQRVSGFADAASQPASVTQRCGLCHVLTLP